VERGLVLTQQGDGFRVQRYTATLVGLGVLEDHPVGAAHVVLVEHDNSGLDVDVFPLQRPGPSVIRGR
jgi:hypothetical protein